MQCYLNSFIQIWTISVEHNWKFKLLSILCLILLHEKFLQFDWLRAVVFQLNLKYLHVKITNLLRVVTYKQIIAWFVRDIWHKYHSWYFKIVSNFTRLTACEITYNNFEVSLVVFIPNITTNHAITYTNTADHSCNFTSHIGDYTVII